MQSFTPGDGSGGGGGGDPHYVRWQVRPSTAADDADAVGSAGGDVIDVQFDCATLGWCGFMFGGDGMESEFLFVVLCSSLISHTHSQ
jgi:hypothetical protein